MNRFSVMSQMNKFNWVDFGKRLTLLLAAIACLVSSLASAKDVPVSKHEAIAIQLEQALNARDYEKVAQLIDLRDFARTIATKMFDSKKDINGFISGFTERQTPLSFAQQTFLNVESGGTAKFMGTIATDNTNKPLLRINYEEGGLDYMLLHINGRNKIKDFYFASRGKDSTQAVLEALQLTISPSKSFLLKMLGQKEMNEDLIDIFKRTHELRSAGNYPDAYHHLMTLPEEVKQSRTVIDSAIQLSSMFDENLYRQQLQNLATYHGESPDTQFLLMDHYMYIGNFAKAQQSVDMIIDRFGEDGALYDLKASLAVLAGEYQACETFLQKALQLEPDYEDAYWTLVTVRVESGNYSGAIESLERLQSKFSFEFSKENFEAEPFYSEFVKSDAYKNWSL